MASTPDDSDNTFEPVTWSEARNHLVRRLMMDDEWILDGEQHLVWWPTPFPVVIEAEAGDQFPGSEENWIRLTARTTVGLADEATGPVLATEFTDLYPVGALVYHDGELTLRTSFAFNPRNRPLLTWFHDSVLIQAAVAVQLAEDWRDADGVEVITRAHPTSGDRTDVDELVEIYLGDTLGTAVHDNVMETYAVIRPRLRATMEANGFTLGFHNEEVDFFNLGFEADDPSGPLENGAFDMAVGFMPGSALDRRYGPSLMLLARILPPGRNFTAEQASMANASLSSASNLSLFGAISGSEAGPSGSQLRAMVPHLTLAAWAQGGESMLASVVNAITHVGAAAQRFRRDILGIEWPPSTGD